MVKTSKFDQLAVAVTHAELIPANRNLTACGDRIARRPVVGICDGLALWN